MDFSIEKTVTNWGFDFCINVNGENSENLYKNFLNFTKTYYDLIDRKIYRVETHNPTFKYMKNLVDAYKSKYGEAAFIFKARGNNENVDINLLNYVHSFVKGDDLPYDNEIIAKTAVTPKSNEHVGLIHNKLKITMKPEFEKTLDKYSLLIKSVSKIMFQEYLLCYYNEMFGEYLRKDSEVKEFLEETEVINDFYRKETSLSMKNMHNVAKKYNEKIFNADMICHMDPLMNFKYITSNIWIKMD